MVAFHTPILYLIFNRPDLVKQTFPQIKAQRPKQLFIGADGPREGNENDLVKCAECRDWMLDQIDWDCEVKTLFRDENLGCGLAVSGAITWFFEHVEMGIILEDDILTSKSFFQFCELMLMHYQHETDIMHIGGVSFLNDLNVSRSSYYFSNYMHIWGWATWRRSWELYDFNIVKSDRLNLRALRKNLKSRDQAKYWLKIFNKVAKGEIDTWDHQWHATIFLNSGLCIKPLNDLVENHGFGEDATHTVGGKIDMKCHEVDFPLMHPINQAFNYPADKRLFSLIYKKQTPLSERVRNLVRIVIPSKWYLILKKVILPRMIKFKG